MTEVKRRDIKKGVVLAAIVLWVILAVLGSTGFAALGQSSTRSVIIWRASIFDPFTLRTIVLSNTSSGGQPDSPPGLINNPNPRRVVRIPFRLPVRSPCKPGLDQR